MAKAAPPTELQSVFALFNACTVAIGDVHNYRARVQNSQPAALRQLTINRLRHLPRRLESALNRRPNTPPELDAMIRRAIEYYRVYGASTATRDQLQAAVDWARTYLQEHTTRRVSGYMLPPYTGAPQK